MPISQKYACIAIARYIKKSKNGSVQSSDYILRKPNELFHALDKLSISEKTFEKPLV